MKRRALECLRAKLAANEPTYGLWVTLESASITEMAVALGIDWVVVDAEHGHLDWKEINEHIRAALRSDTVVLVRVAERSTSLIKRALDIGGDGVVIPWVETVAQLQEALRDCRYPSQGRRGIGGERATVWGQCFAEHASEANAQVLVVPIIESTAAIPHVPAMCAVDGIDIFFFGPADFSASAGYPGEWQGPGVAEQILQLTETIRLAGKHCGVMATSVEDLLERRAQGFRMLALGADSGLLLRSLHQALQSVERDLLPATSLDPADGRAVRLPLAVPPADTRPDRNEVISVLGERDKIELASGVGLEVLVGDFNRARGLTTGIVTLQPQAMLPYHTHPVSESITVLEGSVEFSVEGRVYQLDPFDNITIPRWLPHQARNAAPQRVARIHVALATAQPTRQWIEPVFEQRSMPGDSIGIAGFERVTRFAHAKRQRGVGPGAEFVDYFNADLMPGIEMSGGFARFEPGGRLPDHLHDFDESICIVRGRATCCVEGRRYSLENLATAMVPRGRVHYFINDTQSQMDMIWVYAGPLPERIVIEAGFVREPVAGHLSTDK